LPFSAPSFNEIQVSFSIIEFKFVLVGKCCMCAGPDTRCNHGWQRRFRQSDCLYDDRLLRHELTSPPQVCPGHRWSDDHGRRIPPLRLRLFSRDYVARRPFARDWIYSDGCSLGKRELDPTRSRLPRFVSVPVARRSSTSHGSAVSRQCLVATAARSCGAGGRGAGTA
jgi:hypothetical protein